MPCCQVITSATDIYDYSWMSADQAAKYVAQDAEIDDFVQALIDGGVEKGKIHQMVVPQGTAVRVDGKMRKFFLHP